MTTATVANMRRFREANPQRVENVEPRRCVAYSPATGETYSADAGDYFYLPDDAVLRDGRGMPMVLAISSVRFADALTGEAI